MNLSLIEGKLEIILDTSSNFDPGLLLKLTFGKIVAFRCLQESYMNALWHKFSGAASPGRTFLINESQWVAELSQADALFAEMSKGICHYVISSDAEVLEVLSKFPPHIEEQLPPSATVN